MAVTMSIHRRYKNARRNINQQDLCFYRPLYEFFVIMSFSISMFLSSYWPMQALQVGQKGHSYINYNF